MGLAIISVIVFHFVDDCRVMHHNYNFLFRMYCEYVSSSNVDVFLLLSGFGLFFSFKKNSDYKLFYTKRASRILMPYLVLSVPAWLLIDFVVESRGFDGIIKDLLFINFITEGRDLFWYILMILSCYALFPFFYKIIDECNNRWKLIIRLLILFVLFTGIALLVREINEEVFKNANKMLLRFPPFILGVAIGKLAYNDEKPSIVLYLTMLISVALIGKVVDCDIVAKRYILALFNMTLYIVMIYIIEAAESKKSLISRSKVIVPAINFCGKYSLELYLSHVAIRNIMKSYGYMTCRYRFFLVEVVLSVIVAYLLARICKPMIQSINTKLIKGRK